MRRGSRDRRGLCGEEHRRGQGRRAKRSVHTQILSSGTPIAKEHVGTGVGETGGKRVADAVIKALQSLQNRKFSRIVGSIHRVHLTRRGLSSGRVIRRIRWYPILRSSWG